jgi:2',3'-cyclic-nucleotide 2'-phosphodiesterase/3'-nucleotidase
VGVIGFVPPQIMQWDRGHLEGRVRADDIVDAARRHLPDLRAAGADLVVALCHSGISGGERRGGEENAALHLAAVDGIDVILTGHQHLVFPSPKDFSSIPGVDPARGTLRGKPAVMAGFWGSHLGVIDLDLRRDGGAWRMAEFRCEARPIFEQAGREVKPLAASDAAVLAAARADHECTLAYVREPVGATSVPIHSYFSLVADDARQAGGRGAELVRRRAAEGHALTRPSPPVGGGALQIGRPRRPGNYTDIPAGPLAIRNLGDIYVFPNTVKAVRVTGAQLRAWLERSAGLFNRLDPSRPGEQALIDGSFPGYNFDVIAGVRYRIDPTQPSRFTPDGTLADPNARRIVDLSYRGRPVEDHQIFIVATNNYRASGGGNFPGDDGTTTVLDAPDLTRDVIARFIIDRGTVSPEADGSWSLLPPPPGVIATFLTGPGAGAHRPAGIGVEPIGEGPDGFVKYRLAG